ASCREAVPDVVAALVLHLDVPVTGALNLPLRNFGRPSVDSFIRRTNGISGRQRRGTDHCWSNEDAYRNDCDTKASEGRTHLHLSRLVRLRVSYDGKAVVVLLGLSACQF